MSAHGLGRSIVLADSLSIPSLVRIDPVEERPNSDDIPLQTERKQEWFAVEFGAVVRGMRQQEEGAGS